MPIPTADIVVHLGVVTYFEEPDSCIFLAWTYEELERELYDYVCENWEGWFDIDEVQPPDDHSDAINMFFEGANDNMKLETYTQRLPWPASPDAVTHEREEPVFGFGSPAIIIAPQTGDALDRLG